MEVKKQITATEPIIPDEDPDRAGKRRVVYAVTYTNGEVTKRDILSMVTLSRPRSTYDTLAGVTLNPPTPHQCLI